MRRHVGGLAALISALASLISLALAGGAGFRGW
jgi:hypothetical protein